ncbi:MAG TPA: PAS domain S-box protein [Terriglobales bacterium]
MKSRAASLLAYSSAIAFPFLALAFHNVIRTWGVLKMTTPPFLAAVVISAWIGEFSAGLLATAVSVVLIDFFLISPYNSLLASRSDLAALTVFAAVSIFLSWLTSALVRERRKVSQELERRLKEQDERIKLEHEMRLLLESTAGGIYGVDTEGRCTFINTAASEMLGYSAAELMGKQLHPLIHPTHANGEPYPMAECKLYSAFREAKKVHVDNELLWRKDGSSFSVEFSSSPIISDGVVKGAVISFTDITSRQQVEEALRENEQRLRMALTTGRLGSWGVDLVTGEMQCSDICKANFGRSATEPFSYQELFEAIHPDHRKRVRALVEQAIMQRSEYEAEYRIVWPDGSSHWIMARGRCTYDADDKPLRIQGVTLDTTEVKRAEELLRRTEKLTAASRFAATISHEINNPLAAVTNLLYLIKSDPSLNAETRSYAAIAEEELARVAHITKQTLAFYKDETRSGPVSLPKLLDEVLALHKNKILAHRIEIERDYQHSVPVIGLKGELWQIFSNLISNAIDAMPQGGKLGLNILSAESAGQSGPPALKVEVRDTGAGISPANLERIFEPFFTTKQDVGTGLGLWITQELVQKHGGRIKVESKTGANHGCCFSLLLPVNSATEAGPGKYPSATNDSVSHIEDSGPDQGQAYRSTEPN